MNDDDDNSQEGEGEEEEGEEGGQGQEADSDEEEEDDRKRIPSELLTRVLHEFFPSEGTRVTRDANEAVGRYMDIFVREAIARAAAERKGGGFLEVCGSLEGRGLVGCWYCAGLFANGWGWAG